MQTTATAIHSRRIVAGLVPAARMSLAEPIASGRLETKMAASRLTLTPSPAARPMPSTACSGMPSRKAPRASAGPAPPPDPRRSTSRSSTK